MISAGPKRSDVSKIFHLTSICIFTRYVGNGAQPCAYCHRHGQKCERSKNHRQSHEEKDKSFHTMAARVAKLEALLANLPCIPSSYMSLPMASGAHDEMQTIPVLSPHFTKVDIPGANSGRHLGLPNQRISEPTLGSPRSKQPSMILVFVYGRHYRLLILRRRFRG